MVACARTRTGTSASRHPRPAARQSSGIVRASPGTEIILRRQYFSLTVASDNFNDHPGGSGQNGMAQCLQGRRVAGWLARLAAVPAAALAAASDEIFPTQQR
eukprot:scaffold172246_cov39-Prasinocladus_malaysianus.AAC.1